MTSIHWLTKGKLFVFYIINIGFLRTHIQHILNVFCRLFLNRSAADASDSSTSSGLHGRILSTFLNELDGIVGGGSNSHNDNNNDSEGGQGKEEGSQQVLVIAACQDITNLDEALVRPG